VLDSIDERRCSLSVQAQNSVVDPPKDPNCETSTVQTVLELWIEQGCGAMQAEEVAL
jgi:hypothetical protein